MPELTGNVKLMNLAKMAVALGGGRAHAVL